MAAFSYHQHVPCTINFAYLPSVPPFDLPEPPTQQQPTYLAPDSSCFPWYYDPSDAGSMTPAEIAPVNTGISTITSNTTATPTPGRSCSPESGGTVLSGDNKISSSSSSAQRSQVASETRCSPKKKRKELQRSNSCSAHSKDAERKSRKLKKCSDPEKEEDKARQGPPTGYIHVRARRGQATDSHSLAERVRRERIKERMKMLQGLVPGCDKVVGKAILLDEIINYVRSLQNQVEFLSMKLASINPILYDYGLDFDDFLALPEKLETMPAAVPNVQRTSRIQPTVFADTANNYTVHDSSVPLLLHEDGPSCPFPEVFHQRIHDNGSNFVTQVGNDGQSLLNLIEFESISSFP